MFALRGIAVSLSCFVLLYSLLSALVAAAWRPLRPLQVAQQSVAAILFALRTLPLLVSVIVTFALVVPSFRLLEPRSIEGGMAMPLALGVCALLLIAYSCYRVIAAQTRATRLVTRWLEGTPPLRGADSAITFHSQRGVPR